MDDCPLQIVVVPLMDATALGYSETVVVAISEQPVEASVPVTV